MCIVFWQWCDLSSVGRQEEGDITYQYTCEGVLLTIYMPQLLRVAVAVPRPGGHEVWPDQWLLHHPVVKYKINVSIHLSSHKRVVFKHVTYVWSLTRRSESFYGHSG